MHPDCADRSATARNPAAPDCSLAALLSAKTDCWTVQKWCRVFPTQGSAEAQSCWTGSEVERPVGRGERAAESRPPGAVANTVIGCCLYSDADSQSAVPGVPALGTQQQDSVERRDLYSVGHRVAGATEAEELAGTRPKDPEEAAHTVSADHTAAQTAVEQA